MRNDCMENINNASVNAELIEEQAKIREKNNKADKKALFSFVVLIIASMLVGGVGGFYAVKLKMHGALDFQEMIFQGLAVSMPYVLGVAILMAIFGGFFQFSRYRRQYREGLRSLDEDALLKLQDKIEYQLNFPMVFSSVSLMIGFFEIPVILANIETHSLDMTIIGLVEFIIDMALVVILQLNLVNFEKEMNPEKKGSVLSKDFHKTWIDSCDEAEKSQIYEAAFFSYSVMGKVYTSLWTVSCLGIIAFDWGVLPAALITILWAVQQFSYLYKAAQFGKEENGEN